MDSENFETLPYWKDARELTRKLYDVTKRKQFSGDSHLAGMITTASVSVMDSIVKGFESHSNNEFIEWYNHALRLCSEIQNSLYIALDQTYISDDEFQELYDTCETIRSAISALIRYV